ncbi:MAG: hypothetical protein AAGF24_15805 [Cyanobacteria bacterium P01_H01_bin.121]
MANGYPVLSEAGFFNVLYYQGFPLMQTSMQIQTQAQTVMPPAITPERKTRRSSGNGGNEDHSFNTENLHWGA